ncbi:hypothetical protein H5410_003664 [Solanum commersonii]|uniref:Uncharacterized protein n=1 Tax=Solanum commersonii TaxID=4109 RepID=A0A9J6B5Q8_SOLCO|nr:hypothetical protein H5410_003664 [Solanum commersonii]
MCNTPLRVPMTSRPSEFSCPKFKAVQHAAGNSCRLSSAGESRLKVRAKEKQSTVSSQLNQFTPREGSILNADRDIGTTAFIKKYVLEEVFQIVCDVIAKLDKVFCKHFRICFSHYKTPFL